MSILDQQLCGDLPIPGKTNLDWYLFHRIVDHYRGEPMLEVLRNSISL